MILDGEIIAFDESGRPSFKRDAERSQTVVFYAFDLCISAASICARQRMRTGGAIFQCVLPSALVQLVHAEDDGVTLYSAALASASRCDRQAQGQPLRGRQAFRRVCSSRRNKRATLCRGYTKGQGAREPLARCSWATGRAADCSMPRTSAPGSTTAPCACALAARAAAPQDHPFSSSGKLNARRLGQPTAVRRSCSRAGPATGRCARRCSAAA